MNERKERTALDWTTVEKFEKNGIALRVNRLGHLRRFSFEIGLPNERGLARFFPVVIEGKGKLSVVSLSETVRSLFIEAEEYVLAEAQKIEDEIMDRRLEFEQKQLDSGKPKVKPGLKALSKRGALYRIVPPSEISSKTLLASDYLPDVKGTMLGEPGNTNERTKGGDK